MSYYSGMEQNKYNSISSRSIKPRRSNSKNHRVQNPQEQKLFDTNNTLIQRACFDLTKSNYEEFIARIRNILNSYRPIHTPYPIMEIVLVTYTNTGGKKKRVKRIIKGFILKSNVYFLAVHNGLLFEFGDPYAKDLPRRLFLNSSFLGFSENYSAMGNLVGLVVGYNQLHEAIVKIANDIGRLSPGRYNPILAEWKMSLLVIIVMICEGARFKPLSHVFYKAIVRRGKRDGEVKINEQMKYLIHHFASMTTKAKEIVPCRRYTFPRYTFPSELFDENTDGKEMGKMCSDKVFCQNHLGVLNRQKIGFDGKKMDDEKKKVKTKKEEQFRNKPSRN